MVDDKRFGVNFCDAFCVGHMFSVNLTCPELMGRPLNTKEPMRIFVVVNVRSNRGVVI